MRETPTFHDKGGYYFDAKAERKSFDELEAAKGDWLLEDARKWGGRIMAGDTYLHDTRIETVRLHVGTLLRSFTPAPVRGTIANKVGA